MVGAMHRSALFAVLLVACAGCGALRASSSVEATPPTEPSSPPSTAAPPPTPPTASPSTSSPTPPAASAASTPPYPEAWIHEAELDNTRADCRHLVYKRGCSELRRGEVVVEFTLEPDGTVKRVEEIENTVHPDPQIMSKCVRASFPQWRFHPPEGASPTFRRRLVLGDKC
jgi:hypothetical protein